MDSVDFELLSQLVREQKMTINEAIVLMVRERALLLDDQLNLLQNEQSFLNCSSDILEAIIDFKDDCKQYHVNEHINIPERSRSMTPITVSLQKLVQRLSFRLSRNGETKQNAQDSQLKQEKASQLRK